MLHLNSAHNMKRDGAIGSPCCILINAAIDLTLHLRLYKLINAACELTPLLFSVKGSGFNSLKCD